MNSTHEAAASSSMIPGTELVRHAKRSKDEWDTHKPFIEELYPSMTLKDIERMLHEKGFLVNGRQLKRKIADWRLDKNIKANEMRVIAKKRQSRGEEGKPTRFRVRGQGVKDEKIDRWLKREKQDDECHASEVVADSPTSDISTPSAISYSTISQTDTSSPLLTSASLVMNKDTTQSFIKQTTPIQVTSMTSGEPVPTSSYEPSEQQAINSGSEDFNTYANFDNGRIGGQSPVPSRSSSSGATTALDKFARYVPSRHASSSGTEVALPGLIIEVQQTTGIRLPKLEENEEIDVQKRLGEYLDWSSPCYPTYVQTLQHLIEIHIEQGRYNTAEIEYEQLLERCKLAFGPGNPRTLRYSNRLARILRLRGRIKTAAEPSVKHAESSLVITPLDPSPKESRLSFGRALGRLSCYAEAEIMLRESFGEMVIVQKPDEKIVLDCMTDLAWALMRSGENDESVKICREVISASILTMGTKDHGFLHRSFYSVYLANLANAMIQRSKYSKAEVLSAEDYGNVRLLGSTHPEVLRNRRILAEIHQRQRLYSTTNCILVDIFSRIALICGLRLQNYLIGKYYMVDALSGYTPFVEAEKLGRDLINMCQEAFGTRDIETIHYLAIVGSIYERAEYFDAALGMFERAMGIATDRFGAEHPAAKRLCDCFATALQKKERADRVALGDHSPDTAENDHMSGVERTT